MFIKCVVSNIWWSDFFSWRETASNKCFCNIIITRVTRPSPSWTRYQLVFYFRLSSAVRWLTEDLTRASVSLTTRWPWGACCPCWGPRRVTAPTTSVCRTDCRGPARLKVNSVLFCRTFVICFPSFKFRCSWMLPEGFYSRGPRKFWNGKTTFKLMFDLEIFALRISIMIFSVHIFKIVGY